MTRAYIRLDPAFDERKHAYPDGAYSALVATLCLAESQPLRGRFRDSRYLVALLGKRGRWVKFLLEHGDLAVTAEGRAYVVGWDEWQEGDWKVGERVRRIRSRRRVTPPVTVAVTPPVTVQTVPGTSHAPYSAGGGADLAVVADDKSFDETMATLGVAPVIRGKSA